MRKKFFKMLIGAILCITMSVSTFLFAGCKTDDDFIYVRDITFVTNGETITKKSIYYESYDMSPIEEAEFLASNVNKRVYITVGENQHLVISKSQLPPEEHWGEVCYRTPKPTKKQPQKFIAIKEIYPPRISFYKGSYIGETYYYVIVRVIDNRTLEIRDSTGTTVYTVSSYKIRELT